MANVKFPKLGKANVSIKFYVGKQSKRTLAQTRVVAGARRLLQGHKSDGYRKKNL